MQHLMWLPRVVLACVSTPATANHAASSADLLLYPRYHLDNASLLGRFPLQQVRPLGIINLGVPLCMCGGCMHSLAHLAETVCSPFFRCLLPWTQAGATW